jgi:uncharacterized protein YjiS (DUF1127 family)
LVDLGVRRFGPAGFRAALARTEILPGIFVMSLASIQSRPVSSRRTARRVVRFLLSAWERYRRHRRHMHELAELAAMDDLDLRDVGISRCEVRGAIRSGEKLPRR